MADLENRITHMLKDTLSQEKSRFFLITDINMLMKNIIISKSHRFVMTIKALEQLSPLSVMKRGYSIAMDEKENIIRSVKQTEVDAPLRLHLYDGSLRCTVNSIDEAGRYGKEKTSKE